MSFFHLAIEDAGADSFVVSDRSDPDSRVEISFKPSTQFTNDLTKLRLRGSEGPLRIKDQEPIAERLGLTLFNTFLPPPIAQRFDVYRKNNPKPRVALHLPRTLFDIPWEVLMRPDEYKGKFLCLTGSIVRCDHSPKDSGDLAKFISKKPLKILAVSSNPKDRPVLGEVTWKNTKQIKFKKLSPATFKAFADKVCSGADCDGFIFWGHGDIDKESRWGVLVFLQSAMFRIVGSRPGESIQAYAIGDRFQDDSPLRLAYVFACESASWGAGATGFDFAGTVVGALLDRTPLGFVVGAQTPLDVHAAEACIATSFSAFRSDSDLPLDLAITEGRKGIRDINPTAGTKFSALDWWVPAVYVKPAFLKELDASPLPSQPSHIALPPPDRTATASPPGGFAGTDSVSGLAAFGQIAADSVKSLFSA